ncbi:MAG: type III pantothenate kinase [Cyclobacteriaceae bacterium]|nr:type III pantothenate kinase [Cyclobacteriaceae bacterium]
MLLAIDIGNSDVTLGLWADEAWKHVWRVPSKPELPELFFGVRVRDYFLESGANIEAVQHIVLSSVVPRLTEKLKSVVRNLFGKEAIVLGPGVYDALPIDILNPYEIGSDLVANALAAHQKYRCPCIVVDFGTALTFTTLSGEGKIIGVSITPGLKTAIRALSQNTARLFDVPLEMPSSALGKNTITAIQSGILFGYEGLVKNMVGRLRQEVGENVPAIATGGLSSIITPLNGFFTALEPHLTLDGLRLVTQFYPAKH